jgi:hypothetical protein
VKYSLLALLCLSPAVLAQSDGGIGEDIVAIQAILMAFGTPVKYRRHC